MIRTIRFRPAHVSLAAAWLASSLMLVGCGSSGPEMAPVSGTVSYNGEPLKKGMIAFVSSDPARQNATAMIGPDGSYTLQTIEPGDGAQVGDYTVTVTDVATEEILDYIPKGKPAAKTSTLPDKYGNPDTSGVKVTVQSGSNTIPIELKD